MQIVIPTKKLFWMWGYFCRFGNRFCK